MQNRQVSHDSQLPGASQSRFASLDSESSDSQSRVRVLLAGGEGPDHVVAPPI